MASSALRNRTFRETRFESIPLTRCQSSHHESARRFIWHEDLLLGGGTSVTTREAARDRRMKTDLQSGPKPFRAYRLVDEGLRPVWLSFEGQDFDSVATSWEQAHVKFFGKGGPSPVVDEDGTIIGYYTESSDNKVKKMRLFDIEGVQQVLWFDEPGLQDSIGNDLLLIVGTLSVLAIRVLLKTAAQRILLRLMLLKAEQEVIEEFGAVFSREVLLKLMKDTGPTVRLVTSLSQKPIVGRPLSTAVGDAANALAGQAGPGRQFFTAEVPKRLLMYMERWGLAKTSVTSMGKAEGTEIAFTAQGSEFIVPFFR